MRALPPGVVTMALNNALWSVEEEAVLARIPSVGGPVCVLCCVVCVVCVCVCACVRACVGGWVGVGVGVCL